MRTCLIPTLLFTRPAPALALTLLASCNGHPDATTITAAAPAPADTAATGLSWALLNFAKVDSANPILGPSPVGQFLDPVLKKLVRWEEKDVFNPAVVVRAGKVYMLYRAENKPTIFGKASRVGLASSPDGIHFVREKAPVLYPAPDAQQQYETGGTEDPRVVEDARGTYYMTYTAYDGKLARLHVASSPDLRHWTKYGNAFGGKYLDK